jgi:hypothetical protein
LHITFEGEVEEDRTRSIYPNAQDDKHQEEQNQDGDR